MFGFMFDLVLSEKKTYQIAQFSQILLIYLLSFPSGFPMHNTAEQRGRQTDTISKMPLMS